MFGTTNSFLSLQPYRILRKTRLTDAPNSHQTLRPKRDTHQRGTINQRTTSEAAEGRLGQLTNCNQTIAAEATMRLSLTLAFLVAAASPAAGFAPSSKMAPWGSSLQSTVEAISGAEIKSRMDAQMEKLKAKDQGATAISAQVSYLRHERNRWSFLRME
jgi:hypothetical protein